MRKLFKVLIVFCLVNVSCKTGIDSRNSGECELFEIGNYEFYNPRVYDRPIVFKKGSHDLLNNRYKPVWYPGYCAINLPSYFKSKEDYLKHVSKMDIEKRSVVYYENFYKANKENLMGRKANYHKDYHLLFRGTVNVKNLNSGNEYLLVAGRSYISKDSDFDKNTEFYGQKVEDMLAFRIEDGIYKSVDIALVLGTFNKMEHEKVFNILSADRLVESVCIENVNTLRKSDFNSNELPNWVYNKSKSEELY